MKIKKPTIDGFSSQQMKPFRIRKSEYQKHDHQTHAFPAHKYHNPSTFTSETAVASTPPARPNDSHSQMLRMEEEFEKRRLSILGKHNSLQKHDTTSTDPCQTRNNLQGNPSSNTTLDRPADKLTGFGGLGVPRDSANVSLLYEYLPHMQRPYRSPRTKLIADSRKMVIRVKSQNGAQKTR